MSLPSNVLTRSNGSVHFSVLGHEVNAENLFENPFDISPFFDAVATAPLLLICLSPVNSKFVLASTVKS